jgi:hypothetical protein
MQDGEATSLIPPRSSSGISAGEKLAAELGRHARYAREHGHEALEELLPLVRRASAPGRDQVPLERLIAEKWHQDTARAESFQLIDRLRRRGLTREADVFEDMIVYLDKAHGRPRDGFARAANGTGV